MHSFGTGCVQPTARATAASAADAIAATGASTVPARLCHPRDPRKSHCYHARFVHVSNFCSHLMLIDRGDVASSRDDPATIAAATASPATTLRRHRGTDLPELRPANDPGYQLGYSVPGGAIIVWL